MNGLRIEAVEAIPDGMILVAQTETEIGPVTREGEYLVQQISRHYSLLGIMTFDPSEAPVDADNNTT